MIARFFSVNMKLFFKFLMMVEKTNYLCMKLFSQLEVQQTLYGLTRGIYTWLKSCYGYCVVIVEVHSKECFNLMEVSRRKLVLGAVHPQCKYKRCPLENGVH